MIHSPVITAIGAREVRPNSSRENSGGRNKPWLGKEVADETGFCRMRAWRQCPNVMISSNEVALNLIAGGDYNQQPATPQLKSTKLQGPRLARFGVTGAIPSAPTHLSSYPLTAPITLRTPASSPPSISWGPFPLTPVSRGLFSLDTNRLSP